MDKRYPRTGSQRRIILDSLLSAAGAPVAVRVLMHIASCSAVHSTVAALRKKGYNIQNKQGSTVEDGRKVRVSEYWIDQG